jgi:3-phenylpropionate/trans-cinnamate dioxygenase ferredoxin reductase subunit
MSLSARSDVLAPIVVVGGGHAGVQTAASLRGLGHQGGLVLIAAEPVLPYQRPSLSKAYLAPHQAALLPLRAATFFADQRIDLRLGTAAVAVDRAGRMVSLDDGTELPYEHLVLATGARARHLPGLPTHLSGVHTLREAADARALRQDLARGGDVLVVGGGFLGLEAASVARAHGCRVRIVEAGEGLMGRAVSTLVSNVFAQAYAATGIEIRLRTTVVAVEHAGERVAAAELSDGSLVRADVVLIAIGATPRTELAAACGLAVDAGVLVDDHLRTADPAVSAVGDCAQWSIGGRRLRRESVQNATDHARCLADRLAADPRPYQAVPWFWSDQAVGKLQIVGVRGAEDTAIVRGDVASGAFSVFHFAGGQLTCVESVDRTADHLAGRKLLDAGATLTPEEAADPATNLRALVTARLAA